jgi:hypothetical protein
MQFSRPSIEEVQPHMASGNVDIWMNRSKCAKAVEMWAQRQAHKPPWSVVFKCNRASVRDVEVPSCRSLNRDPAMAPGMPVQRYEPHVRVKRQTGGWEAKP